MMDFVKLAELVNRKIEARITEARKVIEREEKKIASGFQEDKSNIWKRASTASKLVELGMMTESQFESYVSDGYAWGFSREREVIKIDEAAKLLPLLHKAFGQCKVTDDYEELSAEQKTIKVKLDFGRRYHGPTLYLERKLPKDAPCQYVVEVQKEKKLVCKRKER